MGDHIAKRASLIRKEKMRTEAEIAQLHDVLERFILRMRELPPIVELTCIITSGTLGWCLGDESQTLQSMMETIQAALESDNENLQPHSR